MNIQELCEKWSCKDWDEFKKIIVETGELYEAMRYDLTHLSSIPPKSVIREKGRSEE